jgi:hypothetical protein
MVDYRWLALTGRQTQRGRHTAYTRYIELPVAELQGQGYAARLAKKFALELACRHSGESQRHIGEYFGYRGNGAVGKQRQRLRELLEDNND